MSDKIKIGISSCLLGNAVRYNGGHQLDRFLTQTLGKYVEYIPVCPEVECGLPVPRESMRLVGDPDNIRLMTRKTKIDHTDRMLKWANEKVQELKKEDLCGFIFKAKSPSSGMERIKIYGDNNKVFYNGVGLFAKTFMDQFPLLPVEEDGRLHDFPLRANFIERIFTMQRWRQLFESSKNRGGLVSFHTTHKLLIMSHSVEHYRKMGSLVAHAKDYSMDNLLQQYGEMLLNALKLKATIAKNINVLHHIMGYFKKDLSSDEKQELLEIFAEYKKGYVPLIVPITLINHYVRKYSKEYLQDQHYLNPHPSEMKLRTHI